MAIPAISGISTNNTTDKNNVSQGTVTFDIPNKNFTIGTNAKC